MKVTARPAVLTVLAALIIVALGLPALGAEDEEGATTETTLASVSDPAPAVVVTPEVKVEPLADWTYRYLIPTSLVLGAVVILLTSIRYFTAVVRKRYRIVE
ncbi:MAG TPA: hypothetical protein EYP73_03905 [Acidimicrobiia bacterium]|nr:hypothetical protein [Acidimicrobiia bacterium]